VNLYRDIFMAIASAILKTIDDFILTSTFLGVDNRVLMQQELIGAEILGSIY
jgi:hypothetical protein